MVDNDGIHGPTEKLGQLGLKAGLHPLRVEWFNAGTGAALAVLWAGPGFDKQSLPPAALRHPAAGARKLMPDASHAKPAK